MLLSQAYGGFIFNQTPVKVILALSSHVTYGVAKSKQVSFQKSQPIPL